MSFLEIKCFIIEGECILPMSATILWHLPIIILLLILIYLTVKFAKVNGGEKK